MSATARSVVGIALLAAIALIIAFAVGAISLPGSDDDAEFTREQVEETMSGPLRDQLPAGMTMDQLQCVKDGDADHWKCFTYTRKGGQRYSVSITVTCDPEVGQCLSEPFNYIPTP